MALQTPEFILEQVSYVLIDDVINTFINPAGGQVNVGTNTVAPGNMLGIYVGAMLVAGGSNSEVITVLSTTATTFTAVFVFAHGNMDPLTGATFPAGQADGTQLYTQEEILGYLADAQEEFLLRVQPVYEFDDSSTTLTTGTRTYAQPADCIRLERISVLKGDPNDPTDPYLGVELYDVSQTDLDWADASWPGDTTKPFPKYWYQDNVGNGKFGVGPLPQVNIGARLAYSQNGSPTIGLLDDLLVPDVMIHALKYGVLAKCFDKDGEQRDVSRAQYCQGRFDFIALLAGKFMNGTTARVKDDGESVEPLLAAQKAGK